MRKPVRLPRVIEPPEDWQLSERDVTTSTYEKGERVFGPGDADDGAFVVIEGKIAVFIQVQRC